jgi:hypothetical protein
MHTTYMAQRLSEYVRSCYEETINWLPGLSILPTVVTAAELTHQLLFIIL